MEFDQRMQRKSLANSNINKYNKHLYIVPIKCVVWKLEKDQGFVMMLSFAFNYIFIIFLKSLQWLWFLAKKKNVASLYLSSVKHGQAQKKKKKTLSMDENGYRSCWDCYSAFSISSPLLFWGLYSHLYYISSFIFTLHVDSWWFMLILVLSASSRSLLG